MTITGWRTRLLSVGLLPYVTNTLRRARSAANRSRARAQATADVAHPDPATVKGNAAVMPAACWMRPASVPTSPSPGRAAMWIITSGSCGSAANSSRRTGGQRTRVGVGVHADRADTGGVRSFGRRVPEPGELGKADDPNVLAGQQAVDSADSDTHRTPSIAFAADDTGDNRPAQMAPSALLTTPVASWAPSSPVGGRPQAGTRAGAPRLADASTNLPTTAPPARLIRGGASKRPRAPTVPTPTPGSRVRALCARLAGRHVTLSVLAELLDSVRAPSRRGHPGVSDPLTCSGAVEPAVDVLDEGHRHHVANGDSGHGGLASVGVSLDRGGALAALLYRPPGSAAGRVLTGEPGTRSTASSDHGPVWGILRFCP